MPYAARFLDFSADASCVRYQCDTDNEFLDLMIAICVRPRTDGATFPRKHRFPSSRG